MTHPSFARGLRGLAVLLSFGLLVACGSKDETPATGRSSASNASASSKQQDATAEQVAREARGKLKCPVKTTMPPRAPNAPVDDIVGVRPGMSYDEAAKVVMCSHELMVVTDDNAGRFRINTYGQKVRQGFGAGFAQPRVTVRKTDRDWARELASGSRNRSNNETKPGESRWYVGTMGAPGQERVVYLHREEAFEEGRQPTTEGVVDALIKKYGQVTTRSNDSRTGSVNLSWAYDPRGRLITETSPLFRRCHAAASFAAALGFSPDCGIVVSAQIVGLRDNHALAKQMHVVVVDQAGAYDALQKTEQFLAAMDAQRRAKEVEAASKTAAGPTL